MSLIYIFTFSKVETDHIARLMGAAASASPPRASDRPVSGQTTSSCLHRTWGQRLPGHWRNPSSKMLPDSRTGVWQSETRCDPHFGLCGGLTADLRQNTVVAYTECLSSDGTRPPYRCSPPLTERISSLLRSKDIPCSPVVGITSPRIATTKEIRLDLARSGAQAVDMESYEILEAAMMPGFR